MGSFEPSYDNWLKCVLPNDRDRVRVEIDGAIKKHAELDSEYRIVRPDGAVRCINCRGQALYDEKGNPMRVMGIMIDVTGHKQALEEIRRLNAELKRKTHERNQHE